MDLETENKIAAILLKEAAELRRQAEKEGVHAYIHQPTVRGRPNSRFLTATVLGVQQANRAVEVNEMWRLRQKELELDNRLRGTRNESSKGRSGRDASNTSRSTSREYYENESHSSSSSSSKKRVTRESHPTEDDGLGDDEMEEFLHATYLFAPSPPSHFVSLSFSHLRSSEAGVLLDQGWMKLVRTFLLVQIPSKNS